jgi:hypothetical protein
MEVLLDYYPPFPFSEVSELSRFDFLISGISINLGVDPEDLTGELSWLSSESDFYSGDKKLSWLNDYLLVSCVNIAGP